MKIKFEIDLSEYWGEDGETMGTLINDIIKDDIERKLKRMPEYKAYIKVKTEEAINRLDLL